MRVPLALLVGAVAGVGVALPVRHFVHAREASSSSTVNAKPNNAPGVTKDTVHVPFAEPAAAAPKPDPVYVDGVVWAGPRTCVFLTNGREIPASQVRAIAWDGVYTVSGEIFYFRPRERRETREHSTERSTSRPPETSSPRKE